MKKLLLSLAALCLSISAVAADEEYTQDEKNWIATTQPFYKEAKSLGISSLVGIVKDPDAGSSPVQMMFRLESQECVFLVAVRDNFASKVLQGLAKYGGAELARAVATAHEFGHCLHNVAIAKKMPGYETLPPVNSPESEAMADVFSLAWFAINRPDEFNSAQRFVQDMRKLPGQDRKHDTRNFLFAARDLKDRLAAQPATPFAYAQNIVLGVPLTQTVAPVAAAAPAAMTTAMASAN